MRTGWDKCKRRAGRKAPWFHFLREDLYFTGPLSSEVWDLPSYFCLAVVLTAGDSVILPSSRSLKVTAGWLFGRPRNHMNPITTMMRATIIRTMYGVYPDQRVFSLLTVMVNVGPACYASPS